MPCGFSIRPSRRPADSSLAVVERAGKKGEHLGGRGAASGPMEEASVYLQS